MMAYDTSSSSEEENEGHQSEVHQADTPHLRPRDKTKPPSRYNPEIYKISKMLQLMPKQEMLELSIPINNVCSFA